MGRKRTNVAAMIVRLHTGQPERIDEVLKEGEKQADFLRAAVDREVITRQEERTAKKRRRS